MPLFALNHGPSSAAEWRERIAALEKESGEAQGQLEAAKQARANADAESVFTGKTNEAISKLEAEESKAERRVQALTAAREMAGQQLQKALAAEEAAEKERLRQLRAKLRGEIVQRSGRVDQLFSAAAAELAAIDGLLSESFRAGRGVPHRIKWYATRAAFAGGLREYFDPSIGWSAREPLSIQLDRYLAEPEPPQEKSA